MTTRATISLWFQVQATAIALLMGGPAGLERQPDSPIGTPPPDAVEPPAGAAPQPPPGLSLADAVILRDAAADRPTRAGAADRLLAATDPEVRAAMLWMLSREGGTPDACLLILERAAATPNLQPAYLEPCIALVEALGSSEALRAVAVLAIASIRTREAARTLISWLDDRARPNLREPAARALARLTGRADLGADPRRWSEWFSQVEWLPELEWRTLLALSLAEATDRAERERDRSTGLLLESVRQRFLDAVSSAQRSSMLVQFLRHELPSVRKLGIHLTRQELANARQLEPTVAMAAEALLTDPSREFRKDAAELLGILTAGDGGQAIAAALVREEDQDVVAPLLRSAARNPSPELTTVVIRWLEGPAACREPALSAAASLYAAGYLTQAQDIRTLRDALRALSIEDLTPGANGTLAMYYTLGDERDRAKVRDLLRSGDATRRIAAAELLSNDPAALDALLAGAADDPTLLAATTRGVALHRATIEGYEAIAALNAPSVGVRREMLLQVAGELPPRDLLRAALAAPDALFREAILARLTETQELQAFGVWRSSTQTPHPAVVAGLLLLSRTRLELGQPAGALEVLSDLEPILSLIDLSEVSSLYTVALLWLNRIEQAQRWVGAPADWIDGLEKSISLPHAQAIAKAIDARFGDLEGEDGQRFQSLRNRLPRP